MVSVTETRRQRFESVVAEVADAIHRYALRRTDSHTAEDVLAETLLVVWRRLDDVPDEGRLPWCYAVARRCLANLTRSARRQRNLVARIARVDPPLEVAPPPEPADSRVARALATLRPDDQELLRLWALEDLAPIEIAAVLGITPSATRVRLHRARGRLAAVLGNGESRAGQEVHEEGGAQ